MAQTLLFITGVLAGFIAGYFVARRSRGSSAPNGTSERLLEERLSKADAGLEQFSRQLETQNVELNEKQQQLQEALASAAVSRTQLEGAIQERDALRSAQATSTASLEQIRAEKERLSKQAAEAAEKLRSQESQTQFLEQARADLLTQFRSLSGQMLDGSREALLKSTKETVSEPFAKEMERLRQQMQTLQKESVEKLGVLAQTTMDLRQRSEDVQGAAQQLTSALRSPNVKGRWGEVNLRRILEFVGLISYCDFDEQVHVGTEDGAYRPDCVITIPGSRKLIVDSKAPIESYLDALQAIDEAQREAALKEHLRKVRSHVDLLSKKDYAGKLSSTGQVVDAVVLFIPVEGALSMELERDPDLLEYAFSKNIILTFPTSLLAILKELARSIQQAEIATNIEEIQNSAVELHKRFLMFIDKFNSVGSNLTRLNKSYNEAVGSAQSRLIPQGKRFAELAGQNSDTKLNDAIESVVREIQPGE